MTALSLPLAHNVVRTNGMPKAHRSTPIASCRRSGWKVLNMNWMHLAALRRKVGSSASV